MGFDLFLGCLRGTERGCRRLHLGWMERSHVDVAVPEYKMCQGLYYVEKMLASIGWGKKTARLLKWVCCFPLHLQLDEHRCDLLFLSKLLHKF